jgi:hypothetical protein
MKFASMFIVSLSATAAATADVFLHVGEGMVMWRGGCAISVGGGSWVGSGWSTFPGVNPPWNPVMAPAEARVAAGAPSPRPALGGSAMLTPPAVTVIVQPPAPTTRTYTMFIAGESVTFRIAQDPRP